VEESSSNIRHCGFIAFETLLRNQRIINTNTNYLPTFPLKETRRTTVVIKLFFSSTLQTVNFTEPFYARPVVLVTPKHSDNNNNSNLSGSRCNAVTAWVEVRNTCCDLCVSFVERSGNGRGVSHFSAPR
jgi:hypothetical protein